MDFFKKLIFVLTIVTTEAFACKPCDGDPLAYSVRNSDLIVKARLRKPPTLKKNKKTTTVSADWMKQNIWSLEVETVLRGPFKGKQLQFYNIYGSPCTPTPMVPLTTRSGIYFLKRSGQEFIIQSYCGIGALEVADDGVVRCLKKDGCQSDLTMPLDLFIRSHL